LLYPRFQTQINLLRVQSESSDAAVLQGLPTPSPQKKQKPKKKKKKKKKRKKEEEESLLTP
jgi:hypothetical protein